MSAYLRYPASQGSTIVLNVGTFDSQAPAPNGALILANSIYFQSASAAVPGMVNTGSQTFTGVKTFQRNLAITNALAVGTPGSATSISTGDSNTLGLTIQGVAGSPPPSMTFLAMELTSIDADFSVGSPTGTAFNGAAIVGGKLDLTGGTSKYVTYPVAGNADFTQTGTIRMVVTPNYTGPPVLSGGGGRQVLFSRLNGIDFNNFLELFQNGGSGVLTYQIADSSGSISSADFGVWSSVAGQSDEIELDFNFTTGTIRCFINGVQSGSTATQVKTVAADTGSFYIGYAGYEISSANISVSNIALFNTVQHTSDFPGEIPHTYMSQVSDLTEWLSPTAAILAKVDAVGNITGNNLSGINTGNVSLAAVGSSPNANGASLSVQVLTLQPADGTHPGVITSGSQTIGGAKTFASTIAASNLSGTNTGDVTLGTASGLSLASQVLSLGLASAGVTGALSGADWSTFNSKQAAGNYLTALTGDAAASGPGSAALTLATVNSNVGSFGDATHVAAVTVNGKGLVTAAASTSIQIAESQVTNLVSDLAGKQATGNYITALTGDVTASGPGSVASTIAANAVTNAKAAQMAAHTFKGNNTGSTANALDLTATQLTAELNQFTTSLQGVVPGSGGGTTNFLRADGSWAAPSAASPVALSANSPNNAVSGSYTTIKYQTVPVDTDSAYSTTTGRFTVPTTGLYLVTGFILLSGTISLGNQIDGYILKNNTTQLDPFNNDAGAGFSNIAVSFTSLQSYTVGDTIEIQISTNVTSPSLGGGNLPYNHISIQKL